MITLGYIAATLLVGILLLFILWFALGAMHQHLKTRGEGFGRDHELHNKVDELLQEKRNNATFTTKH